MPANVFLTDDSIETIEALFAIYNEHPGFKVIGHGWNRLETFRALHTIKIDILSMDIELEQESGIELCKQVRAEFPSIFLVMCSVEADFSTRLKAERAGASYFLAKPFGLHELNAMLLEYQQFKRTGGSSSQNTEKDDVILVKSFMSLLDFD